MNQFLMTAGMYLAKDNAVAKNSVLSVWFSLSDSFGIFIKRLRTKVKMQTGFSLFLSLRLVCSSWARRSTTLLV